MSRKLKRDCETCKYNNESITDERCYSCSTDQRENWEPKKKEIEIEDAFKTFNIEKTKQKTKIKDSGSRTEFTTGAVRDMHEGKGRCDLLPWDAIHELAIHCEQGGRFRHIKDSIGYYITDCGKVFSARSGKWLKLFKDKDGYLLVNIYYSNNSMKTRKVHRLVAKAFIENKEENEVINHKDENKENNYYKNLEWSTVAYNNSYGERLDRVAKKAIKKVYEYNCDGEYIRSFQSASAVAKQYGVGKSTVNSACNGRQRSLKGKIYKYYKAESVDPLTEKEVRYARRYL